MNIPTRAGREAVERLTEAEATAFINRDKETIKTELDQLTLMASGRGVCVRAFGRGRFSRLAFLCLVATAAPRAPEEWL